MGLCVGQWMSKGKFKRITRSYIGIVPSRKITFISPKLKTGVTLIIKKLRAKYQNHAKQLQQRVLYTSHLSTWLPNSAITSVCSTSNRNCWNHLPFVTEQCCGNRLLRRCWYRGPWLRVVGPLSYIYHTSSVWCRQAPQTSFIKIPLKPFSKIHLYFTNLSTKL